MRSGDGDNQVTVGPYYKIILIAVIVIFGLSLVAYVTIGMVVDHPTDAQLKVFDVLDFVVKSTLGAIRGLLGAKIP